MPTQVIQAQFTEKYSLTKEKVPNIAQEQDTDDYCPRVQLKNLIESCGPPTHQIVIVAQHIDQSMQMVQKITAKIDDFVRVYW